MTTLDAEDAPTRLATWRAALTRAFPRPVRSLLALALFTRVAVVVVAWAAAVYFGTGSGWNRGPGFVQAFARWDSGFYMDIAQMGYGFKPEAWSFNPGYPLVVGLVWRIVPGIDLPTAGFVVSNAAFFAALVLFYRLSLRWFDERTAWRAAAFLALVPGAFYFSAVYAESLFLLLLVGALLAVDARRWILAGALASCAAITRPPGLFLVGAMGVALLLDAWKQRRILAAHVAGGLAALTLPAAFALYSWRVAGDAMISTRSRETYWPNVQWHNPLTLVDLAGIDPALKALVFAGMGLVVLTVAWLAWHAAGTRQPGLVPVLAYSIVLGVVYVAYSEPNPILRYLVALPAVPWMLARASRDEGVFLGLAAALAALQGLVAAVFATWGPLY